MWFYTNPVIAVRAVLTGAATVANRRQQDGLTLVDLTLQEGDKMTLAIRPPSNLPLWVRWVAPQQNLGEFTLTTTFYGYEPVGGVSLPMGYTTKSDWRNVDQVKIYVDQYVVDGQIPNLSATATFPPAPTAGTLAGPAQLGAGTLTAEPIQTLVPQVTPGQGRGGGGGRGGGPAQAAAPQPIGVINVAPGVWRFAGGTMAMEFADHITLFELNGSNQRVHQVVEQAHQLVPGKRATQVIWSHHHFDHSSGIRQAVAEGLTIISRRDNGVIFSEMASRRAPNFPDDLERNFQPLKFMPVDDYLQLKDEKMTVDIYHVIANNHLADGVFAYIPQHRLYIEADVLDGCGGAAVVGRQLSRQHQPPQARCRQDSARAHGHHDLRRGHSDAASGHRAREAVLPADAAEGELVPRLPGRGEVASHAMRNVLCSLCLCAGWIAAVWPAPASLLAQALSPQSVSDTGVGRSGGTSLSS